jgi:hypothetical protein
MPGARNAQAQAMPSHRAGREVSRVSRQQAIRASRSSTACTDSGSDSRPRSTAAGAVASRAAAINAGQRPRMGRAKSAVRTMVAEEATIGIRRTWTAVT